MIEWSTVTKTVSIGTQNDVKYLIDKIIFVGKRITKISCYAVAQVVSFPFSIYPVVFTIESDYFNHINIPLEIVAVPQYELIINTDNSLTSSPIYIVSGTLECDIFANNYFEIRIYARPVQCHTVAPLAFCMVQGEYGYGGKHEVK